MANMVTLPPQSDLYRQPGPQDAYRGPPPDHYRGPTQHMTFNQPAPRQRTAIACRYCRRRKVRTHLPSSALDTLTRSRFAVPALRVRKMAAAPTARDSIKNASSPQSHPRPRPLCPRTRPILSFAMPGCLIGAIPTIRRIHPSSTERMGSRCGLCRRQAPIHQNRDTTSRVRPTPTAAPLTTRLTMQMRGSACRTNRTLLRCHLPYPARHPHQGHSRIFRAGGARRASTTTSTHTLSIAPCRLPRPPLLSIRATRKEPRRRLAGSHRTIQTSDGLLPSQRLHTRTNVVVTLRMGPRRRHPTRTHTLVYIHRKCCHRPVA